MSSKTHFVLGPNASGAQVRTELMNAPNIVQRQSTKQLFLSSRNDQARFGRSLGKFASRPMHFTARLSQPIHHPLSMKTLQFSVPMDQIYNIHANYANDTLLLYRSDRQETQVVTIPPGNYRLDELPQVVNTYIPDSWLSFQYDLMRNRMQVLAGEGNASPGIVFAQQFGGLAEMLGFSANEHYDPHTGLLLFPSSSYYADSPPKLWTFEEIFLHVDEHLGGTGRAFSDAPNELMVANSENGLDQVFQFYQGENSADARALQAAAPKDFSLACASVPLGTTAPYQSVGLHNNGSLEGSFLERYYTHHAAQQYNNLLITQVTVSLTNEFGQLLIVAPTTEMSVKLQFTTAH